MHLLSPLYQTGSTLHRLLHRWRLKETTASPLPTICVGNLVCGGSGKTPLVAYLADCLGGDRRVAILSRGYRSKAEKGQHSAIMCDGHGPILSARDGGDEPHLLARHCPRALILVNKRRVQSAHLAKEKGAKLILLDDGMQHFALQPNWTVVVAAADDPLGQRAPFLREPLAQLKRADIIVLHRVKGPEPFARAQETLAPYSSAPICGTTLHLSEAIDAKGGTRSLKGMTIAAFCGLGNPEGFFADLKRCGARCVSQMKLPDHVSVSPKRLNQFIESSLKKGAEAIVCTEKDWVKLDPFFAQSAPLAYVRARLEIAYGKSGFASWLGQVNKGIL